MTTTNRFVLVYNSSGGSLPVDGEGRGVAPGEFAAADAAIVVSHVDSGALVVKAEDRVTGASNRSAQAAKEHLTRLRAAEKPTARRAAPTPGDEAETGN